MGCFCITLVATKLSQSSSGMPIYLLAKAIKNTPSLPSDQLCISLPFFFFYSVRLESHSMIQAYSLSLTYTEKQTRVDLEPRAMIKFMVGLLNIKPQLLFYVTKV